ncbi:hypothetical protein BELL_0001g00130 [Botrytis elliptica]|uniref:2EXR domain-containing protein n=1 Tax=Botrytis elliptica TaxID=278938 RepID=A0A4Z1KB50_9HELO|nr:hypothetical protein EAE99_000930 [Botrytis elliptica]TGO80752.1 hypothetical protein BELL_0001g00130 [Botrytis elliptica]
MELNDVASITEGKMNDPGPSPETEIDNPYRYIFATEEPVFHRFPKLPQEVRNMIWDWAVDHDSTPDVVLSSPTFPNTPFLFQVCRESLAACLRRYTIFRHPDAYSTGDRALDFFAWIDYERDVLELNDCFDRQAMNRVREEDRLTYVSRLHKDLLLPVKNLGIDAYDLLGLINPSINVWQRFAEICPKITHLKIIFRDCDWGSSEPKIPHKRCLRRLDMNNVRPDTTIDRTLHEMEQFIALRGSLSYEVELAELAPSSELEEKVIKRQKQAENEEAFNELMYGPVKWFKYAQEQKNEAAFEQRRWATWGQMWWEKIETTGCR